MAHSEVKKVKLVGLYYIYSKLGNKLLFRVGATVCVIVSVFLMIYTENGLFFGWRRGCGGPGTGRSFEGGLDSRFLHRSESRGIGL